MSRVILITGASRGIGRNIAYNLALEGNKIIANYNNSEEEVISLKNHKMKKDYQVIVKELRSKFERVEFLKTYFFGLEKLGSKVDGDVGNLLSMLESHQSGVYNMMCKEVKELAEILEEGKDCYGE